MPNIARNCIPYTPFTGKLEASRICLFTTAGVHLKSQPPFVLAGDTSVRMIPSTAEDADLGFSHEHYDWTDAAKDVNCVFPIGVLRELVTEGRVGSSTLEHLSMGFSQSMREIREKTSFEIASAVRKLKADAVLLTAG
jgi:D-proline reductase (dithiol) PrdB